MNDIRILAGLADDFERYDGYLVDAWGVVHDGKTLYRGAAACLAALRDAGKRVLVLSNASRRNDVVAAEFTAHGIERDCIEGAVTSGEGSWRAVTEGRFGDRFYYLGPVTSHSLFDGLADRRVTRLGDADFLWVAGIVDPEDRVADYEDILRAGVAQGLPFVCANSDLTVIHHGRRKVCAGALATVYRDLGGTVHHFGKPHRAIYDDALAKFAGMDPARILAIGDSFDTDIPGALSVGLDCLFVIGGIHAEELGGDTPSAARLQRFYAERGLTPTAAIPRFRL